MYYGGRREQDYYNELLHNTIYSYLNRRDPCDL